MHTPCRGLCSYLLSRGMYFISEDSGDVTGSQVPGCVSCFSVPLHTQGAASVGRLSCLVAVVCGPEQALMGWVMESALGWTPFPLAGVQHLLWTHTIGREAKCVGPSGPTHQVDHATQGRVAGRLVKVRACCVITSEKALSPTRPERAESESM